jgi:hypothetical protein
MREKRRKVKACMLSFFLLFAVRSNRFSWTFAPVDTSLGTLEPSFVFPFFILILLLLPLTYFFFFLPVLTDDFSSFRNGDYLDCRWGNTSIIFRFLSSRIFVYCLFDHWSWGGRSFYYWKEERDGDVLLDWTGIGDWIGLERAV